MGYGLIEDDRFESQYKNLTKRRNAGETVIEVNRQLEIANRRMTTGDREAAVAIQRSLLPDKEQVFEGVGFSWVV